MKITAQITHGRGVFPEYGRHRRQPLARTTAAVIRFGARLGGPCRFRFGVAELVVAVVGRAIIQSACAAKAIACS
jgi:hypothetical protein